jgi:hypothetical protein
MLNPDHMMEGACYTDDVTRKGVVLGILFQCYQIFRGTTQIQKLDELVALYGKPEKRGELSRLLFSFDPIILDATRIAICFESFFKAKLLFDGYIIHNIDKNINRTMANRQSRRPIKVSEVSGNIFEILCITTIGWRTLTKKTYVKKLCVQPRLISSLKSSVDMRNNLHYLIAGSVTSYTSETLENFLYIRNCFNEYVVDLCNDLFKDLGFPANRLVEKI